jgi:hypothetical protein
MIKVVIEGIDQYQMERFGWKAGKNIATNIGRLHEVIGNDIMGDIDDLEALIQFQNLSLHSPNQVVRRSKIAGEGEDGHGQLLVVSYRLTVIGLSAVAGYQFSQINSPPWKGGVDHVSEANVRRGGKVIFYHPSLVPRQSG